MSGSQWDPRRGATLWDQEEIDAAASVLRSGRLFRYGDDRPGQVDALEQLLVHRAGGGHALATSSGTAALICALVGLGVGPGDEVIVPAVTFIASVNAVAAVGARVVLAEVDDSLTLAPASVEERCTPRTKAIVPVHLANVAADMDALAEVARTCGLRVLEDAAQAVGVSYRGRPAGAIGDAGVFSFNDEKNVATGEGGALLARDREVYERAAAFHDQGGQFTTLRSTTRRAAGNEAFLGQNLRMTELTAAIATVQFGRLDAMLARLRESAQRVRAAVGGELPWRRIPDPAGEGGDLTILLGSRREALLMVRALRSRGVPAALLYGGLTVHASAAVQSGLTASGERLWDAPAPCPESERLIRGAVAIPLGAGIADSQVSQLAGRLTEAAREALKR